MPGPGMYDTSLKFPGPPAYSFGTEPNDRINPGPGAYEATTINAA